MRLRNFSISIFTYTNFTTAIKRFTALRLTALKAFTAFTAFTASKYYTTNSTKRFGSQKPFSERHILNLFLFIVLFAFVIFGYDQSFLQFKFIHSLQKRFGFSLFGIYILQIPAHLNQLFNPGAFFHRKIHFFLSQAFPIIYFQKLVKICFPLQFQEYEIFGQFSQISAELKSDSIGETRVHGVYFSRAFFLFFHFKRKSLEKKQQI